jgi:hypothetical protein
MAAIFTRSPTMNSLSQSNEAVASSRRHGEMHAEHRQWSSEISLWRDDIATWQSELEHAKRRLAAVTDALNAQAEILRRHAAAIRLHEQRQAEHESALAKFEQGASGLELMGTAEAHQDEASKQAERRERHEHLKKQQHTLLARFNVLVNAITGSVLP